MNVWALALSSERGCWTVVGIYSTHALAKAAAAPFDWCDIDIWNFTVDQAPDSDIGR